MVCASICHYSEEGVISLIYDCFCFFNEFDVLELRFNLLYDIVDKFVLVEYNKTLTGKEKPYFFEENREKYKKYLDKIIVVHLPVINV